MNPVNVDSIVRSVAICVVGLPLVLSLNNLVNVTANLAEKTGEENPITEVQDGIKAKLAEPCVKYMTSTVDSKLERQSKNEIDDVMGGDVDHRSTCKWAVG